MKERLKSLTVERRNRKGVKIKELQKKKGPQAPVELYRAS